MLLPAIPNHIHKTKVEALSAPLSKFDLSINNDYQYYFNSEFSQFDYDQLLYQNSQVHSSRFLSHLHEVADRISAFATSHSKILEIGCGKGYFIDILSEHGLRNLTGYDVTYEGHDNRILPRYFDETDHDFNADLIILRHTLEHIPNPVEFLHRIANINGNPNAVFIIEVPCFDWIIDNSAYWDITIEHCNYFTDQSFRLIFFDANVDNLFDRQYLLAVGKASALSLCSGLECSPTNLVEKIFASGYPPPTLKNFRDDGNLRVSSSRYWVWGSATKGVMYLYHMNRLEPASSPPLGCIDINPEKQGHFLGVLGYEVISPQTFFDRAREGDDVIVSNPTYLPEIQKLIHNSIEFHVNILSL